MMSHAATHSDAADIRVSVLIPVFNRRQLIEHAVRSALLQDVEGLEVVAVDNCSDDGTWELLQRIDDPRLRRLRNQANVGMFGNFNRCGALARGKYALFLCSDDWLASGFLADAVAQMEAEPSAVLLSSRGMATDARRRRRGVIADLFRPGLYEGRSVAAAWFWTAYHYGANPLNYPSGVMFRTSALRACLPFRTDLGAPADVDMYLRVLRHGDLLVTGKVGCTVMKHDDQEGLKARAGSEVTRQQLALMEVFRTDLEAAGAYSRVRRQSASLVFAALVRTMLREPRRVAEQFRGFGRGMGEMLATAAKCIALRSLDTMFGIRLTPYLRAASGTPAPRRTDRSET